MLQSATATESAAAFATAMALATRKKARADTKDHPWKMKNNSDEDLWFSFYSVHSWSESSRWRSFLRGLETIIEEPLHRLDKNDPQRRKSGSLDEDSRFCVEFGEAEHSRWLFGNYAKSKISFSVLHYRDGRDGLHEELYDNVLKVVVPAKNQGQFARDKAAALLLHGCEALSSYFATVDSNVMRNRKNASPPAGTVFHSAELLGISWLTYLGPAHCDFFGRKRIEHLPGSSPGPNNGVIVKLGESPQDVEHGLRDEVERLLCEKSFAQVQPKWWKEDGQYVPLLEEVLARTNRRIDDVPGAFDPEAGLIPVDCRES